MEKRGLLETSKQRLFLMMASLPEINVFLSFFDNLKEGCQFLSGPIIRHSTCNDTILKMKGIICIFYSIHELNCGRYIHNIIKNKYVWPFHVFKG